MARALWRGAVSFGLVYMPVELHTATRESTLPLHMLDSRDFSPVGYQHINKKTGDEVDWNHIVKGYEYKKGDYVVLTDADFRHANVKASETIEIGAFCDEDEVSSIYYDKPYYLAPGKGGGKVYSLLRQTLEATKKVGVATFVMHQRQHLCILAPQGKALVLQTLHFQDEILPAGDITAEGRVTSSELAMAKTLVEQMAGSFNPDEFKDTYHSDLKRRVEEKIKNKETHSLDVEKPMSEQRPSAQVINLTEALKASLAKRKGEKGRVPRRTIRRRKRA